MTALFRRGAVVAVVAWPLQSAAPMTARYGMATALLLAGCMAEESESSVDDEEDDEAVAETSQEVQLAPPPPVVFNDWDV
jgi:hypothetical protein